MCRVSVQRPAVPSSAYVPTAPHDPQNFVFFARLHDLLFASRSQFDSTASCVLRHVPQAKVQLQRELETAEQRANARRQSSSAAADAEALRLAREQAADQRHLQAGRTVIGDTTHAPRWVKSAEVGHRSIRP